MCYTLCAKWRASMYFPLMLDTCPGTRACIDCMLWMWTLPVMLNYHAFICAFVNVMFTCTSGIYLIVYFSLPTVYSFLDLVKDLFSKPGVKVFLSEGYRRIHWRISLATSLKEERHTRTHLCRSSVITQKPWESSTHSVLIQWEVIAEEKARYQLTCQRRMCHCQRGSAPLLPNHQSLLVPSLNPKCHVYTSKQCKHKW